MSSATSASVQKSSTSMVGTNMAASAKQSSTKMHRRSRTGCFTCRLRRKKCDEGKPGCKACRHLGLQCEYKRPMWWSNNEHRRAHKEKIKNIIKRTKLNEKSSQAASLHPNTPPSLCHSLPTSDAYSDGHSKTRAASIDSQFSGDFNHVSPPHIYSVGMPQPMYDSYAQFQHFPPYEVDIKTERQMFVNDIPTRRDSTISTFSTFQPPALNGLPACPENWIQQDFFEQKEEFTEEPLDFNFFDFPHGPFTPSHQATIQVEEGDQHLLNHFIDNVLRLIFPILEVNQHGSARSDVVLPALESNKCYLHCCLSIAAQHLKNSEHLEGEQIDNDIVRHRYQTISELCEALGRDTDHMQILEAALAMIFFQCAVGRPDDTLPDIPWHSHFQAAQSLIEKLELPQHLLALNGNPHAQPPFNMTLASWIDILGATMLGRSPLFAHCYREKMLASSPTGLAELMGCDDQIMYLISEIACLEAVKMENMDDVTLCAHIKLLGDQINLTEQSSGPLANCYSSTGAIRPKQLKSNMTTVFRIAARIYLCSLVPDFDRQSPTSVGLVDQLTEAMSFIPAGPEGFDRSLVWPLLVAGSYSLEGSAFRSMFAERAALMGETAEVGSFGRIRELLKDVWVINDDSLLRGDKRSVHWRDVMHQKGWDFLLI
ncbi:DNA-binding transcriptional regulator ume6 [Diplodia seriata]|uniref:Transcriptional regulatory protein pro-1 n=3 Tax=Diplodia seriata TaxID=420778 RepID=A0A1S8B9A0_9PEZI|nr:Transcriptional regulatory protein pro-1 [Diplodia seriata]